MCFLLAATAAGLWAHNSMMHQTEAVDAAWAQVESNLQRRADLVPQLVDVVRRAMAHESEVLIGVVRERQPSATAAKSALEELTKAESESRLTMNSLGGSAPTRPEELASLLRQSAVISSGVRSLFAVTENYPALRSSDQMLALQSQLEGAENRINAARMMFNEAVRDYNAALVKLPTSVVADAKGLERRPYFKASEGAHVATSLGL